MSFNKGKATFNIGAKRASETPLLKEAELEPVPISPISYICNFPIKNKINF